MSFRRILMIFAVLTVAVMGIRAMKKNGQTKKVQETVSTERIEIDDHPKEMDPVVLDHDSILIRNESVAEKVDSAVCYSPLALQNENDSDIDLIEKLFTVGKDKLPIVKTITYTSRVPWLKGRPAWIADYASHYATSRHFIARSLNRNSDYYTQKVSPGDKFNVLNPEKPINFYLLVDLSTPKMWFYYVDIDSKEKVLLKTYQIGVGTIRNNQCATPVGRFILGDKIATYKPGMMGYFQNEKIEMIKVFGTRWLPLRNLPNEEEAHIKGYGIHGLPCEIRGKNQEFIEYSQLIGKYDSDGCIRMAKNDIEELFSIVITKPTIVEITDDSTELRKNAKNIPPIIAYNQ
ncbi:MAG: L,D-transpeptidase [Simkaniaceae bacterium]|nr:L,D-transpeptidase [Simkaniaceae bacterium]